MHILIIIIIKIQYTKQNQYNNKTFIMFIDRETQYDTKCQCDKNKKYNKKNINCIWIYNIYTLAKNSFYVDLGL